jgi:hypothetical protein
VAEAEELVGVAVVAVEAVFATLAALAREAEEAARRLSWLLVEIVSSIKSY